VKVFLKYILWCLILFCPCYSAAQNLDSLWKVYSNKSVADTVRMKAIHAIANVYLANSPILTLVALKNSICSTEYEILLCPSSLNNTKQNRNKRYY